MIAGKEKLFRSAPKKTQTRHSLRGFYTPFESLDQHLRDRMQLKSPEPEPETRSSVRAASRRQDEDDDTFFLQNMSDVIPLDTTARQRVPPASPARQPARWLNREEMEVREHLARLVCGEVEFEISFSDEYTDGAVLGLCPNTFRKLRRGEFSYQDHVDLHGCTLREGRELVMEFVQECFARGLRCVLIVSGRGLNSRDKIPVLKQGLVRWLTQAPLKKLILAFASARSHDGGAGAFYVLLRRNEQKGTFSTHSP